MIAYNGRMVVIEKAKIMEKEKLKLELQKAVAYGMGVASGKHNLDQSSNFINKTSKDYAISIIEGCKKSDGIISPVI